jgi:hypothetical protein
MGRGRSGHVLGTIRVWNPDGTPSIQPPDPDNPEFGGARPAVL